MECNIKECLMNENGCCTCKSRNEWRCNGNVVIREGAKNA